MRLKTFLATFLFFLLILFSLISIVSVYMTTTQMDLLRERSSREYRSISAGLSRNIEVLYDRYARESEDAFLGAVDEFISLYATNYREYHIEITLSHWTDMDSQNPLQEGVQMSFIRRDDHHYIHIQGRLAHPFEDFKLSYYADVTGPIGEMQRIQHILLMFSIPFSLIAALGFYYILFRIFKPIDIITKASQKIANGSYDERIEFKGKNELSAMATHFNQMAEEIEHQLQRSKDEAIGKQQFIDNFAHEIRTPITSIYGYAEYIQRAPYDEVEIYESTEAIMDRANHMKGIANSLLKLATLRNYEPILGSIHVSSLFDDIENTLKKSIRDERVQLIFQCEVEILEGQEDLIKSLIFNLCNNAIKAFHGKEGRVCVAAKKVATGLKIKNKIQKDKIILSVTDNGCGISQEDLKRITEPFYRVDRMRDGDSGGAGLGLALCQQIAQVHGAKMTIESTLEVGTKVSVIFTSS